MKERHFQELWRYAESIFSCPKCSIHGPSHWKRVEKNGLLIAENIDVDLTVIRLFAIFHDSCRWDDGTDCEHGPRAAELLEHIHGDKFSISDSQYEDLHYSIKFHTTGATSAIPTVGACWDSDRLDLGRVGIIPSPNFLSTQPAKKIAKKTRSLMIKSLGT